MAAVVVHESYITIEKHRPEEIALDNAVFGTSIRNVSSILPTRWLITPILTEIRLSLDQLPGEVETDFRKAMEEIEDNKLQWDSKGIYIVIEISPRVVNLPPIFAYIMRVIRLRTRTLTIHLGGRVIPSEQTFWNEIRGNTVARLTILGPLLFQTSRAVIFRVTSHAGEAIASLKNLEALRLQLFVLEPGFFYPGILANPNLTILHLSMSYNVVGSPPLARRFIQFFHELYTTHPKLEDIRLKYSHEPYGYDFLASASAQEYFNELLEPHILMDGVKKLIVTARSENLETDILARFKVDNALVARRVLRFMSRFPVGIGMPRLAGLIQDSWGHQPPTEEEVAGVEALTI